MKKVFACKNKQCFILFFIIPIFLSNIFSVLGQESSKLAKSIQILSEGKTEAEDLAAFLKKEKSTIKTTDYNNAIFMYIEARKSFNGWIDKLKFELTKGGNINSEEYKKSMDKASNDGKKFSDEAKRLIRRNARGDNIFENIKFFFDFGLNVYKEFQSINREKKDNLKKQLDSLKLRSFDDIK